MTLAQENSAKKFSNCQVVNVKFTAPVLPGDQIDVQFVETPAVSGVVASLKFSVFTLTEASEARLACSGVLRLGQ